MNNKSILAGLIAAATISLTACGGGGDSAPVANHPEDTDFFAPVIALNGDDMVVVEEGTNYIDQGATATDNVDSNVNVIASGSYNTNVAGTYTITYSATDLAGNKATKDRTIKVIRKSDFAAFDGKWVIDCQSIEDMHFGKDTNGFSGKDKLQNIFKVTHVNKILTISKRDIKTRLRGFDNSTCTGAPKIKGTATGRIVYTGEYLDGSYTGEKVDLASITEAHFSREDNKIFEVAEDFGPEKLDEWAVLMGMPKYHIFAKANATTLVEGKLTEKLDGSMESKRPVEYNEVLFTKK